MFLEYDLISGIKSDCLAFQKSQTPLQAFMDTYNII